MHPPAPFIVNPAEAWWGEAPGAGARRIAALLQTESAGGRHQRTVYELFSEMLEKDGHLYAVTQTRLNGLLGLPRRVGFPGAANSGDQRARLLELLEATPRLDDLLRALLDALMKGFAAVELHWVHDRRGRLIIGDWAAHPQEWFAFNAHGHLLLLAPPFQHGVGCGPLLPPAAHAPAPGRHDTIPSGCFLPPPRKFIAMRFGADCRNPYGRGLAQHAYWLYWFKKNSTKFWAIHNEKYGAPTAVATYAPGTSAEDRDRLLEILGALQTDSGIVVPESIQLRLLETARNGDGRSYREFLDWCNDEMSKIVLGATLTSGEGRRSGSLALGRVHELVRQDYIEADARLLEATLNDTLLRWLWELNEPASALKPRLEIETESPEDLTRRIAVDRALLSVGVPIPRAYFHERYGRPAPESGDEALRYDDANFYQYHLQFGILTVNEVRARLGLPQVSWGNIPTASPGQELPAATTSPEDTGTPIQ